MDAGTFLMGNDRPLPDALLSATCFRSGDFDERPVHRVAITKPFYLAECQVTNAQYEMFDPAYRELRGRLGFSTEDDEAVVFVSWHDAVAYCRWLSERAGAEFRLPTEAEWEYACRAGSSTSFSSGDEPPPGVEKNQRRTWFPDQWRTTGENVVPLHVGRTPANPWRLFDMHGNVEEWCLDWYGPFPDRDASDPVGPGEGDFRVTRGGSHSTETYYLRSANRAAAILRTSDDSGATWSRARFITGGHGPRQMPIASAFALRDGTLVLPCDAVSVGHGGTALWMSGDGGATWRDAGGTIAGIHGSAVELGDGRLLAFGRGDEVDGTLTMSVSADRGNTWEYSASPFPPIGGSQRLVLKRVLGTCSAGTDPILLISFANTPAESDNAFTVEDTGGQRGVSGMYCALSFDDGESWPIRRLVSDDGPNRIIEALDGTPCIMGPRHAEVNGYLTACQSADGRIQLISSTNHYSFNLAWFVERQSGS